MSHDKFYYRSKNGTNKGLLLAGLLALAMPHVATADWRYYIPFWSMPYSKLSISKTADSLLKNYGIVLSVVAIAAGLSLLLWKKPASGGQDKLVKLKSALSQAKSDSVDKLTYFFQQQFGVRLNNREDFANKLWAKDKRTICKFFSDFERLVNAKISGMKPEEVAVKLRPKFRSAITLCKQLATILECPSAVTPGAPGVTKEEMVKMSREMEAVLRTLYYDMGEGNVNALISFLNNQKSWKIPQGTQDNVVLSFSAQLALKGFEGLTNLGEFLGSGTYKAITVKEQKDAFEVFLKTVETILTKYYQSSAAYLG